jgi:hypothetical protein
VPLRGQLCRQAQLLAKMRHPGIRRIDLLLAITTVRLNNE